MEESEKRRERLRAMRMEAEQAEVCSNVETFAVPDSLSNPLLEKSASQPAQGESYATPRFDYYTDPMAAFSGNKKRGQPDNQIAQDYFTPPSFSASAMPQPSSSFTGPRNPEMRPSPAHQLQSNSSFDQRMYQAQGPYNNAAGYGSPRGMATQQGTPKAWNGSNATTGYYSSGPHGQRNPRGLINPFPVMHQGTPEAWNGSGGTAIYNSPSSASRGGQPFSPGFGPVRSPNINYGQGRPQWYGRGPNPGLGRGGSPGPGSGRGRSGWNGSGTNSGLGQSGARGQGFHSRGSGPEGRQGPQIFYHKSMDEDPWQQVQPLIWKNRSLKGPGSSNSWLPKSISMKKPRVSEASNKSSSQQSLAEYLAASFNEAVNDSPST
ncbi:hypothetical protein Pint_08492 [Pistacia integerrima]|uniref:Uncharacterized protein n=1 Tax=Pistacia integerrima TaxID=434235 RepID=A0ACC0XVA1_9ROSI|nr:hypothetical protein Pint_08492 [Pistacia integerrima]